MAKKQIIVFSVMLFFGFGLGAFFHIYYKIIRKKIGLKISKYIVNITDLCFGLLSAGIGFAILLYFNNGDFRFYVIISIFSGFYIYYKIFFSQGG